MRNDLIALGPEELVLLSNRGTFKRAERELQESEYSCQLSESPEGELEFQWSDGIKCVFPTGKTVREAVCGCSATTVCRHLVRSILYYNLHHQSTVNDSQIEKTASNSPWSPGDISDAVVTATFGAAKVSAAKKRYEKGILVELVRSQKPLARFRIDSCTVRYLVPGDLRYTHCDCYEPAPCVHALYGIWAFRELAADQVSGLIETHRTELPIPYEILDRAERLLGFIPTRGLGNLLQHDLGEMRRLQGEFRSENLFAPTEVLEQILDEIHRYREHDARFEPEQLIELIGELLIRIDAVRNPAPDVPGLFVRGIESEKRTETGLSNLTGLGASIRAYRKSVLMSLFFQDAANGELVRMERMFPNPEDVTVEPKSFSQLARTPILGVPMSNFGNSQLSLGACKRLTGGRIVPGRSRVTIVPQSFQWGKIRPPLAMENFDEIRAVISSLPPPGLRTRSGADDIFVVPLEGLRNHEFEHAKQELHAVLIDRIGATARLRFPYMNRAERGLETLDQWLNDHSKRPCFIAGRFKINSQELQVEPFGILFENGDGSRELLQPWIAAGSKPITASSTAKDKTRPNFHIEQTETAAESFFTDLATCLEDACLNGLENISARTRRKWKNLMRNAQAVGFHRFGEEIRPVCELLERFNETTKFDPAQLAGPIFRLIVIFCLASAR